MNLMNAIVGRNKERSGPKHSAINGVFYMIDQV